MCENQMIIFVPENISKFLDKFSASCQERNEPHNDFISLDKVVSLYVATSF